MTLIRRLRSLVVLVVALLCLAAPAVAAENFTLHAVGAETGPNTGAAVSVGNYHFFNLYAWVTAGSGTVNPFDVWAECSADGTNWTECAVDDRVKATTTGGGTFTDNTVKVIAETAVTTSGVYSARLTTLPNFIRARWNIVGASPSETFGVILHAR